MRPRDPVASYRARAAAYTDFVVCIPGVNDQYRACAESADDALRDALHTYGLHFAPPGTTVTLPKGGPA